MKVLPVSTGNLSNKNELSANLIPSELKVEEENNLNAKENNSCYHNNSVKHPNLEDN